MNTCDAGPDVVSATNISNAHGARASARFNFQSHNVIGFSFCRRTVKRPECRAPFLALTLVLLLLAFVPTTLPAQLVADATTLNLTTATNLPGNRIVGTNTGKATLNLIAPKRRATAPQGCVVESSG